MRTITAFVAVCALAAAASARERAPDPGTLRPEFPNHEVFRDKAQLAAAFVESWPAGSRALAQAILERYGAPDTVAASQLTWTNRRPFLSMIVYREEDWLGRGVIEQVVSYRVPVARWSELTRFSNGVSYDPAKEHLSARGASEESNLLALNLAYELIQGKRDVAEARAFYKKTLDMGESGKSSSYTRRLRFTPADEELRRRLLRRLP